MGHGFGDRELGRSHVAHEFRGHHFHGLYGWWPYCYNDCTGPYYDDYSSCDAYGG
jgi:hypothetical protein